MNSLVRHELGAGGRHLLHREDPYIDVGYVALGYTCLWEARVEGV